MTSWGPGFSVKKGHANLPYYHQVGFGSFAEEYHKIILSTVYAQSTLDFLFLFDKVNSYTTQVGIFEHVLKKNNYLRFLPYYPTQGFNLSERYDLLLPVLQKPRQPDRPDYFGLYGMLFDLNDSIKEKIAKIYTKYEIPFRECRFAICLLPDQSDFTLIFRKLAELTQNPKEAKTFFVCSKTRDDFQRFSEACPKDWQIYSMWATIPNPIVTEEQKLDQLYSYVGNLLALKSCSYLLGSHSSPEFRFAYGNKAAFRNPQFGFVLDGSSFSHQ